MIVKPLPDEADRRRIVEDLHLSFLVEAGAGSGKTRSLVDRMVALLTTDRDEIRAEVEELAAVTFTRKAASELRERFQTRLEEELREARKRGEAPVERRLDAALQQIDRAFLGTIHSFCGRLLRERPFEAGLDPAFREVVPPESEEQRKRFWHRFLEAEHATESEELAELRKVGVGPEDLYECFCTLDDRPDVPFPTQAVERPESAAVRRDLERLLDRAERLMPREEPEKGWDKLQNAIRHLRFLRRVGGWEDDATFFEGLASVVGWKAGDIVQKRWGEDVASKQAAKALEAEFVEFGQEGGPAHAALQQWYAHRYPAVIAFAQKAAVQYERERRQTGRLGFQDLLMQASELLRKSPSARRDLGGRYRYLLVDEFQDTDPIQAEVIFLLTATDPDVVHWQEAVPRPGALFVVGDPKQSIYRFTRADIAVYGLARRRFEAFKEAGVGDLLSLIANFRSVPAIEEFVNDEFGRRFPDEATEQQAAFAPMRVDREAGPDQGVFRYVVDAKGTGSRGQVTDNDVAQADAEGVAAWIQGQVAVGARKHGDFLILIYRKDHLGYYARALEARNIPAEVTGGKLLVEEELAEFRLLLEALLDPDDPVRTVAVLIGLFVGLDYEVLTRHALAEGSFRLRQVEGQPEGPVREALATMNRWWRLARSSPADVSVRTILDEFGLLPFAAAGELGAPRAGALEFFLEVVREAGVAGDTSLRGAVEALDVALATEEAVAPLQPGRVDVVRVMNLHKAKGTESPVVILAHPAGKIGHEPGLRVERGADGNARGTMEVSVGGNKPWIRTVIARPIDWRTEHQPKEKEFEEAEGDRLLYVAATRARDELLVSRCHGKETRSLWEPFYGCLNEKWPLRTLEGPPRPERKTMTRLAEEIRTEIEDLESERATRKAPSYVVGSVSARVKRDAVVLEKGVGGRGRDWGSAVHQALEAAGRGLEGEALAAACRTALVSNRRPLQPDGEPREHDELVALVGAVVESDLVRRARRAEHAFFEVPFALPPVQRAVGAEMAVPPSNRRRTNAGTGAETRTDVEQGDLFSADGFAGGSPEVAPPASVLATRNGAPLEIVEGVIDLAFRESDGWVIADYKTDVVEDETILGTRRELYRAQVDLYADCWERLTGEPVVERALLFTSTGRTESWRGDALQLGA